MILAAGLAACSSDGNAGDATAALKTLDRNCLALDGAVNTIRKQYPITDVQSLYLNLTGTAAAFSAYNKDAAEVSAAANAKEFTSRMVAVENALNQAASDVKAGKDPKSVSAQITAAEKSAKSAAANLGLTSCARTD